MSINPAMMGAGMGGGNEELDLMAMQQAMGGGGGNAGAGMSSEMTTVSVPVWAVPAVEELVSVLQSEISSGNISPDMLMDIGSPGMSDASPAPAAEPSAPSDMPF
jgi:hypothetical protein